MRLHTLHELDNSEGTVQLHSSSSSSLILHPQPNPNDPNDPLRWPKWKKYICFTSVCAFAFFTNYAIGGLAPAFYPLSLEFDKTMTETSHLLLWPILVLGVFNFFWVPMANYFGKRPVFVFATLLLAVAYLWGALANSFNSLLWSNVVAAFAGSASEALAASIVNDVFFLHERANLMGWYMNAISGGNTIGPLICGFVVTYSSWRVQKWHAFGLALLNFVAVVLFVPETSYDRSELNQGRRQSGDAVSSLSSRSDIQDEKPHPTITEIQIATPPSEAPQLANETYLQSLSLTQPLKPVSHLLLLLLRPLPMLLYPAVIFAFLGFAVSLAWVVAINILNSFILQAPPYNFSPAMNGLINIPALIGNVFGAWIGGWVVDRYCASRSKARGGVFEPETRLHLLVVPALLVPAGCLLFGYGVADSLHWATLFIGNGLVSVGLCAVPTMTMTYVSDSYLPVNEDALTVVVGLKNVVAFGFLYAVVPWVEKVGYVSAFGTQAGVYVGILLLGVPMVVFGKGIRRITAQWRIILG